MKYTLGVIWVWGLLSAVNSQLKIPADKTAEVIEKLVEIYLSQRMDGESFAQFVGRSDLEFFQQAISGVII